MAGRLAAPLGEPRLYRPCSGFVRLTFLAALLFPASSRAAGLQTLEQGTWELGRAMVGATSAADSAATALYNPAGMSLLSEPQVTGGVMAILGEGRFDPDPGATTGGGDGGNQLDNAVIPGGPFVVYPIDEEWALGFSLSAPFVGTLDPRDSNDDGVITQEDSYSTADFSSRWQMQLGIRYSF